MSETRRAKIAKLNTAVVERIKNYAIDHTPNGEQVSRHE